MSLHPAPGRVFLVGPKHTLLDLAVAIDLAFARWDVSHANLFEFQDGRRFGMADDDRDSGILDYEEVVVARQVSRGERFAYVFDLGDEWLHECVVTASAVDPEEVAGVTPKHPIPIWGWGWIPDQYGRRTENGDSE